MDIAARGYANPDLLWSPETLRGKLGTPGLAIIDTRPAEKFARVTFRVHVTSIYILSTLMTLTRHLWHPSRVCGPIYWVGVG